MIIVFKKEAVLLWIKMSYLENKILNRNYSLHKYLKIIQTHKIKLNKHLIKTFKKKSIVKKLI